jgi:hypothetical protein
MLELLLMVVAFLLVVHLCQPVLKRFGSGWEPNRRHQVCIIIIPVYDTNLWFIIMDWDLLLFVCLCN